MYPSTLFTAEFKSLLTAVAVAIIKFLLFEYPLLDTFDSTVTFPYFVCVGHVRVSQSTNSVFLYTFRGAALHQLIWWGQYNGLCHRHSRLCRAEIGRAHV